jgi:hypothetical protein
MNDILTPISPGELLDKLTILQIKCEQFTDPDKLANAQTERRLLQTVVDKHIPVNEDLAALAVELHNVNQALWNIEDDIRDCERLGDFGEKFISLARAVYVTNDRRAALKKQINLALGSAIIEEKSYVEY